MGLEFNYIPNQTPISEEEKEGLLIKTISTRIELDEFEQQNIESAVEWALHKNFNLNKILTINFILEVHKRMFNRTWIWAGSIRKTNKNLGVDKFQITQELKILFDDCKYWIENDTFSSDKISLMFKHRLVSIHPFPNGNGRHSRLVADILITHVFKEKVFSWGALNLTKPGESRKLYLEAIRAADQGNMEPLIVFARS